MDEKKTAQRALSYKFHLPLYLCILILQMLASAFYLMVNDLATEENILNFIIFFACQIVFYIIVSSIRNIDMYCIIPVLFLFGFSLPIIHFVDPSDFKSHLMGFVLGAVGFFLAFLVTSDETSTYKIHRLLYIGGIILVASAAVLGRTDEYGGHSWIHLGGLSLQPSELFKPLMVVLLALNLSKQLPITKHFPFIAYLVCCIGIVILGLNDTGMALILTCVLLITFTLGGIKKRYLLIFIAAVIIFIPVLLAMKPHIAARFQVVINGPFSDYEGAGYHISQGLMMMINGGIFGSGANESMQNLFAASSDFAFISLCSYYGFLFAFIVLAAYALIGLRSLLTAIRMHSRYRSLIAIGAGSTLVVQTIWHIAGLLGLFPLSGITLPFVSAGGTSMVTSFILLGLIQGVSVSDARSLRQKAQPRSR